MKALCASCDADRQKWLDHTGPLHSGVQLTQVGAGHHNVPSWTRTHATLKAQIKLIEDNCTHRIAIAMSSC